MTAEDVIRLLDLKPHPEGGYFRETFRDGSEGGARAKATAIYYLLRERRDLALAPHRCRRDLALVRRSPARAENP